MEKKEAQIEPLKRTKKVLTDKIKKLEDRHSLDLKNQERTFAGLDSEIGSLKTRVGELEANNQELQKTCNELIQDMDKYKETKSGEIQDIQRQLARGVSQIKRLEEDLASSKEAANRSEETGNKARKAQQDALRLHNKAFRNVQRELEVRSRTIIDLVDVMVQVKQSSFKARNNFLNREIVIQRATGVSKSLEDELARTKNGCENLRLSMDVEQKAVKELQRTLQDKEISHSTEMAKYERERQFQLGRVDRTTLFTEFCSYASFTLQGRCGRGGVEGQAVDVCICILSESREVLFLVRGCNGSGCMIIQSRTEDCTVLEHDWQFWLRVGGGVQQRPLYISLGMEEQIVGWLGSILSPWILSKGEDEMLNGWQRKGE